MPSFPAIIEACIAEAERLERRSSPFPFVNEQNVRRIAALRGIALDCQAAIDGCLISAKTVADWFGDDFEHSIWMAALALDDVPQITGDAASGPRYPGFAPSPAVSAIRRVSTIAEEDAARPAHFTLGAVA